jgi:hypothetical protein
VAKKDVIPKSRSEDGEVPVTPAPSPPPPDWSVLLRQTLERYDDTLIRSVAGKLIRPRNEWPVEELLDRSVATVANAPVIDRRLQELGQAERRLLALMAHSRQPRWRLGSMLELLAALGHAEGPRPVFALLEAGLLYPELPPDHPRLKTFEEWLGQASATGFALFAHPFVTARALGEDLGLPDLHETEIPEPLTPQEADGLEWPLRLAVLWQQVAAAPLRRTQQGDFFKRDLDRLRSDTLLTDPAPDSLTGVPDTALLAIAIAAVEGIVVEKDGELRAAALPAVWDEGLPPALASLWAALPRLDAWDPLDGWRGGPSAGNPFPSAYLLSLLLLARLPAEAWAAHGTVGSWVVDHHPYWSGDGVRPSRLRDWASTFLLGVAYQLRWVQAARTKAGTWLVRLSPLGRWVLGVGEQPAPEAPYTQTLFVQPNLEIVAYRQGLTLALIGRLARFATWKGLGAACTLQLEPETVYRALESGETFQSIVQTLEQHGTRATPLPVIESLRTWSNKRDRISVYPSAALLEFNSQEDLNEALARGLPGVRVSERLALVAQESAIDYRHFRLTGTRDYSLPPDRCVEVEPDGVTLSIDLSRSDLLLETELPRFAEGVQRAIANGRRQYRLTPASLAAARESGLGLSALESWFVQRTGQPLSPATRLLMTGSQLPPPELRHHLVLHVATPELAEGLLQWPETRSLVESRLGPTALVVTEENAQKLREKLQALGMTL